MALARLPPLLVLVVAACGGETVPPDPKVRVPDVRGMNTVDAEHALHAAGLRWREGGAPPESRPSPWVPADPEPALVIGQRPGPGEPVDRGAVVGLGQAPPFGAKAIAHEDVYPAVFKAVRPTRDPKVVRVRVGPIGCLRIRSVRAQIAGEVAIANLLLRPQRRVRGCPLDGVGRTHWIPIRFAAPVTGKAVVTGPIVRPRPAEGAEPRAWSRAVPVSPDGRTLAVTWTSGAAGCNALAGVDAEETRDSVRITVREGRPAGRGAEPCRAYAMARTALVRLREPLGSRRLVDGAKR